MSNILFLPGGIKAGTAHLCIRPAFCPHVVDMYLCTTGNEAAVCLMWLFFIPHISTNTHVSLELAIIREVYTLFFNTWDLLKGKCSIFLAKKQA